MTCDICHKIEATVHLTEIIDNQITELHLCEECARQKGTQMEQHFGLARCHVNDQVLLETGSPVEGNPGGTANHYPDKNDELGF